jgi:tRNA A37 threonylcarbamoyladenosine dehydratase
MIDLSYENRFGGLERIYGSGALGRLRAAHVLLVGLGGVGSWTVEALARTGIGTLTLVDLDDVCATNTNRQLHALDPEWGRLKADVLVDRVRRINPEAKVTSVADFFTRKSAAALLESTPTLVVDAIDSVNDKVTLIEECRARGLPVVVSGGAGGKTDPTRVRWADLGQEQGDSLLKAVKRGLKSRGVLPNSQGVWNVECVFSDEPSVLPWDVCEAIPAPGQGGSARIDCATGFGAVAFATGTFGFALASRAVKRILGEIRS